MEKFPKFSQEKPSDKPKSEDSTPIEQLPTKKLIADLTGSPESLPEKLSEDEIGGFERPEWSLSEHEKLLAKQLQDNGYDNPETKAAINEWMSKEEDRVEKENTVLATIGLNLKQARFYFLAGYKDEAFESYREACWLVDNERVQYKKMTILYETILKEMDEVGL